MLLSIGEMDRLSLIDDVKSLSNTHGLSELCHSSSWISRSNRTKDDSGHEAKPRKKLFKTGSECTQREEFLGSLNQSRKSNKGKSGEVVSDDVLGKIAELSSQRKKSCIMYPGEVDENGFFGGFLDSEKFVGKFNGFCQSPQNSMYSGTVYKEAKTSFTNTEISECSSRVDKSNESDEIKNSCDDLVESRKTSIYRCSTSSDVSDESSTSSLSSAMYKPHKANDSRWEAIRVVRTRDGTLGRNHFRVLSTLGCGDIGRVYLTELSDTKSYFAIKVMDKAALASRKKILRAQTEREILQCLDHPFLPTLYTHFETEKSSCLVMEFCPGGDLHALRQKQRGKHFPENAARFYAAEVLLALEYLHMLGIIYRDLKPENVLVREDGHIMLSDFDLSLRCTVSPTLVRSANSSLDSKNSAYCVQPSCIEPDCMLQPLCIQPTCFSPRFISDKPRKEKLGRSKNDFYQNRYHNMSSLPELMAEPTNARSMSFVGTHEYLAPEIIKGEGHGSAVDWWTFGIFLYELLVGRTPFKVQGQGNRETLFNVVGQPLRFPKSPNVSFAARDLIRGLLVKEPQHRLAYRRGATEVKQHPFFQNVNWALIRCASPPDVPKPDTLELSVRAKTPIVNENVSGINDVKPPGNYVDVDFF